MTAPDILIALEPVADTFERLNVRYHVGGSVASSAQGVARATLDIDLVADLGESDVSGFTRDLEKKYYLDEQAIRDAVRRRSSFNLIHLETMVKIDVFVLKTRPYDREAFGRMIADTLHEGDDARKFYIATPEDIIINKLEWFEMGNRVSPRQWRDVIGVMKVQGDTLDRAYMERWALEIGVLDLLNEALAEAED